MMVVVVVVVRFHFIMMHGSHCVRFGRAGSWLRLRGCDRRRSEQRGDHEGWENKPGPHENLLVLNK
jgi:hypothetical protein